MKIVNLKNHNKVIIIIQFKIKLQKKFKLNMMLVIIKDLARNL